MAMKVANKDNESESKDLKIFSIDLPTDITTNILQRLPIKYILICKSVCKGLNVLISDPKFSKIYSMQAPIGFMIRTRDPNRLSRFMHLLEYESGKFENDGVHQYYFCEDEFIKPECDNHVMFDHKLKLAVHRPKLILGKRDETVNKGGPSVYNAFEPQNSKFDVVNSCNGFLCLSDRKKDYFVICNPVIGEFIRLPKATDETTNYCVHAIYTGFGFHATTNEYKVVRFLSKSSILRESEAIMVVQMYTLGTSTWRNVGDFDENISELGFPTCLNDALHWICLDDNKISISCFPFESERFCSLPFPRVFKDGINGTKNISMGVLRGCLYICDSSSLDTSVTMWIMKEYGVEESWIVVFSIDTMSGYCFPYGGLYWPVKEFKSPAAILVYHSSCCFIYYEFIRCRFKCFKVRGTISNMEGIPHIPSFISLKDVLKGDNIKVMKINLRSSKFNLVEENDALFLGEGSSYSSGQMKIYP